MYFVEKTRGLNIAKRYDYLLLLAVIILSCIGLAVLYSATRVMPNNINGDRIFKIQVISFVIGLIFCIVISTIDYKDFKNFAFIIYSVGIVLLIAVFFVGYGKSTVGSQSWINLGPVSLQPSEVAKITTTLMAAVFIERIVEETDRKKNILKFLIYFIIPFGLIMLQPDFGTAMVFIFMFIIIVFVMGLPFKYIIGGIVALIPVSVVTWFLMGDYQRDRILVFLNPELDPANRGYNVTQSKIAIGSGEIWGKGLTKGLQTQNAGIPVKESDFIFAVLGEELGFIGAAIVILLVLFILLRCIHIAKNARDPFGAFVVLGLTAMFAFHYIENIGMCIGLLPVTGIPLPFISQGGTSLIANYIAMGVILSVSLRRKQSLFDSSQ